MDTQHMLVAASLAEIHCLETNTAQTAEFSSQNTHTYIGLLQR